MFPPAPFYKVGVSLSVHGSNQPRIYSFEDTLGPGFGELLLAPQNLEKPLRIWSISDHLQLVLIRMADSFREKVGK